LFSVEELKAQEERRSNILLQMKVEQITFLKPIVRLRLKTDPHFHSGGSEGAGGAKKYNNSSKQCLEIVTVYLVERLDSRQLSSSSFINCSA